MGTKPDDVVTALQVIDGDFMPGETITPRHLLACKIVLDELAAERERNARGGLTVSRLVERAFDGAKAKGWHDPEVDASFGDRIALIHSEVSEALEAFRECGDTGKVWHRADGKPEGVVVELADVVIRIADLCGKHGLDLERAILDKLAFNATRPHRHGGKHL